MKCEIPCCRNNRDKGYSFYTITKRRREVCKWLEICKLPQNTPLHARLCEGHFSLDQFDVISNLGNVQLKPSATPVITTPNPPLVLNNLVVNTFKHDSIEDGNHVFVPEAYHTIKVLPNHEIEGPIRVPLECITNKENYQTVAKNHDRLEEKQSSSADNLMERVKFLESQLEKVESHNEHLTVKMCSLMLEVELLQNMADTAD